MIHQICPNCGKLQMFEHKANMTEHITHCDLIKYMAFQGYSVFDHTEGVFYKPEAGKMTINEAIEWRNSL